MVGCKLWFNKCISLHTVTVSISWKVEVKNYFQVIRICVSSKVHQSPRIKMFCFENSFPWNRLWYCWIYWEKGIFPENILFEIFRFEIFISILLLFLYFQSIEHNCGGVSYVAMCFASVSHSLMTLNSSVNFFIYGFMCSTFRQVIYVQGWHSARFKIVCTKMKWYSLFDC